MYSVNVKGGKIAPGKCNEKCNSVITMPTKCHHIIAVSAKLQIQF